MKHSIVYLIVILSICFVAFPMTYEQADARRTIEWLEALESKANNEEFLGDTRKAISYYSQIVVFSIPSSTTIPDPYERARKIQAEARDKVIFEAEKLENKQDYKEALRIYGYARNKFKDKIEPLEKKYQAKAVKEGGDELIKWFERAKVMTETGRSEEESFFYYGLLADAIIPSLTTPDPYKDIRQIQIDARAKILSPAFKLEKEKNYKEALKLYNYAPVFFRNEIKAAAEKLQQQEEKEEIAKAVEIAQQIIDYNELAEKQPNLKLKWYGEILKLRLSCPPGAPPDCKKAIDIQTDAINTIINTADEFKRAKEYNKALATYQFEPDTFADYIEKLQKLVDILPELKKLTDQNKYDEAYKQLDKLSKEGVREASTLKKELQKQKAEQEKQAQLERERPEREEQKKVNDKFKLFIATARDYAAKKNMPEAFAWYGKIVQEPIPSSITVPDPYQEAKDIQNNTFNEIVKEADKLTKEQKYKEALATYQLAPQSFYHNLAALEKRIAELPDLIKQQEKSPQEQKKLEQELKNALILLTNKLKLLANYIISHAPL